MTDAAAVAAGEAAAVEVEVSSTRACSILSFELGSPNPPPLLGSPRLRRRLWRVSSWSGTVRIARSERDGFLVDVKILTIPCQFNFPTRAAAAADTAGEYLCPPEARVTLNRGGDADLVFVPSSQSTAAEAATVEDAEADTTTAAAAAVTATGAAVRCPVFSIRPALAP